MWRTFQLKHINLLRYKFKFRNICFQVQKQRYQHTHWSYGNKIYPIIFALPLPAMMADSDRQDYGEPNGEPHPYPSPPQHPMPAPPHRYQLTYKQLIIGSILSIFTGLTGYFVYKKLNKEYVLTEDDKKLLKLIASRQQMGEILVLGKAGVGKSYLIDALIGNDLAQENDTKTGTFNVKSFDIDIKIQNYKLASLKIWDSIGFFSELTETQCIEQLYKAKNCGTIFLVINGNAPRLYDDLERLYPILNKLYNGDSWINKTVIVVTRGNEMIKMKSQKKFNQRINEWNISIPKNLEKAGMNKENANNIPIIWAFGKNDKNWKNVLLSTAIERAQNDQKTVLAMIDPYNIKDDLIEELDLETQKIIKNKPKFRNVATYNKVFVNPPVAPTRGFAVR